MTQKRTAARRRTRDGLFQRSNWWWVDYYDAEGRRHRKKAAPDYETAKLIYREIRQAIAKGRCSASARRASGSATSWRSATGRPSRPRSQRTTGPAPGVLDRQILPRFGSIKLAKLRWEDIERWRSERLAAVAGATANKELMRLKHLLNRALAWPGAT